MGLDCCSSNDQDPLSKKYVHPRKFKTLTRGRDGYSFRFMIPASWTEVPMSEINLQGPAKKHFSLVFSPIKYSPPVQIMFQLQNISQATGRPLTLEEYKRVSDRGFEAVAQSGQATFKFSDERHGKLLAGLPSFQFVSVTSPKGAPVQYQKMTYTVHWNGEASLSVVMSSKNEQYFQAFMSVYDRVVQSVQIS